MYTVLSFRPHGDPQMIRFGAHLVLVLRYLLADELKDAFKEKIMTLGDLILHMYVVYFHFINYSVSLETAIALLDSYIYIYIYIHISLIWIGSCSNKNPKTV